MLCMPQETYMGMLHHSHPLNAWKNKSSWSSCCKIKQDVLTPFFIAVFVATEKKDLWKSSAESSGDCKWTDATTALCGDIHPIATCNSQLPIANNGWLATGVLQQTAHNPTFTVLKTTEDPQTQSRGCSPFTVCEISSTVEGTMYVIFEPHIEGYCCLDLLMRSSRCHRIWSNKEVE